jgi:hypothetical protein
MIRSHACLAVLATYPEDAPRPTWQVSYPETSAVVQMVSHDSSKRPRGSALALDDPLRLLVSRDHDHECEGFGAARVCVKVVAVADLPTRFGRFRIVAFWNNRDAKEHVAMVHGDVVGASAVPVRLHSECLTGDVMGSLRCDCRDQLVEGLAAIQPRLRRDCAPGRAERSPGGGGYG